MHMPNPDQRFYAEWIQIDRLERVKENIMNFAAMIVFMMIDLVPLYPNHLFLVTVL